MRGFAFASALSLTLTGVAEAAPRRAVSLNLCTDELLLLLAAPGQIASVTHLSHNAAETPLWRFGRRFPRNDGSLLGVARLRPDLVLTMGGGGGDKVGIARRLGFRVVDLPYPQTLADVEHGIATMAHALGRERQGRFLLGRIAALKGSRPARGADTVWLGGGGRSVSSVGLAAEWMTLAGFRQRALPGDRISREQLLTRPPRFLLRSDYRAGQYSIEQSWLRHKLARGARSETISTDGRRWTCMGPTLIDEIARLRRTPTS